MIRRFELAGAANLEPGDRGTLRFAYPYGLTPPYRMSVDDWFIGIVEKRFECRCLVEHVNAAPHGDVTVTYVVVTVARLERGNHGT